MENPAKYLDKILKLLANDFNKTFTIQEIQNKFTPIEIFGETGNVIFSDDLLIDLRNALKYLESQKLITINFDNGIKITFEGYIKIKTKGFEKEIKEKSINQTLQRLSWVLPIIISTIALIISINKDSPNHKIENQIHVKYPQKKYVNSN